MHMDKDATTLYSALIELKKKRRTIISVSNFGIKSITLKPFPFDCNIDIVM
jgi:hypothetical protein